MQKKIYEKKKIYIFIGNLMKVKNMRRFYFKSTLWSFLVLIVAISLLCISTVFYWNFDIWKNLRQRIRLTEKRSFSVAEMMGSTNVGEVVKPNISTIFLEPVNPFLKVNTENGNKRPFAVILVTSMAKYFNQRHVIRSTWYSWADQQNIRIFFMVGFHGQRNELFQILEEEQRRHNDLIVDDFEEGYYKLPGKVLRMLKWYNSTYTTENAPRFFIKTDQDVFINLPNIVEVMKNTSYYRNLEELAGCEEKIVSNLEESMTSLAQREFNLSLVAPCIISDDINMPFDNSNPETYFIGGKRFEKAEVETDPSSKWYIDSAEREKLNWPSDYFPTYLNGPCYVLSGNIIQSVYEASFTVPLYPFEDVYVVGMIAYDKLNLYISNIKGMILDRSYLSYVSKRSSLKKLVAIHPVDQPRIMQKICQRIKSCSAASHKSGESRIIPNRIIFILIVLVKVSIF